MRVLKTTIAVIFICLAFCGCSGSGSENDSKVIGAWSDNKSIKYEFSPDHTGVCTYFGQRMDFKWKMEAADQLKITSSDNSNITVAVKDGQLLFGNKPFTKVK